MKRILPSFLGATLIVAGAMSLVPQPSRAEIDYPWCSQSPAGQSGTPTCRYSTLEQCQAAVLGLNGTCERNARLVWQEQQQQQMQLQMPRRRSR